LRSLLVLAFLEAERIGECPDSIDGFREDQIDYGDAIGRVGLAQFCNSLFDLGRRRRILVKRSIRSRLSYQQSGIRELLKPL